MKNNKFRIVIPVYNAQDFIRKCIDSIKNQSYSNWECVIVNDCSTDSTNDVINESIANEPRICYVNNTDRKYALQNIVESIRSSCKDNDDIIVLVDGDDWLADNKVLEYLNHTYQDENIWLTYGSYKFLGGGRSSFLDTYRLFQRLNYSENNVSHLRTFKYFLFKKVRDEDLRNKNGKYYSVAWDVSIMSAMAEMAGTHAKFISKVLYVYNNISDLNDNKVRKNSQIIIGNYIQRQTPYMLNGQVAKISIRLLDNNFRHTSYVSDNSIIPNYIAWYRGEDHRDFTIYTDKLLNQIDNKDSNSVNMAWLIEPRGVDKEMYQSILTEYKKFDYVLTYDTEILEKVPNAVCVPAGGTWLRKNDFGITPKNKNVCFIVSDQLITLGHALRHEIVRRCTNKIDCVCGKGYRPIVNKYDVLKDFRYAIVVQNTNVNYYFTEQLMDCLLTGVVPIFWGNSGLGKLFNSNGIIYFTNIEELDDILTNTVGIEDYMLRSSAIFDNFNRAHRYYCIEDYIYLNIIRNLQAGVPVE